MSLPEWSDDSKPVQLVAFEDGGRGGRPHLVVQEDAKRALLKAAGTGPVRVVSVCGVYRSGKSLLLNLLAGTQGSRVSFAVGDSVKACTAGIWARASKSAPGAGGGVCLLLDCEGTCNTSRDKNHDARLFALAVLLSSFLVFNSRGVIDERAVQGLAVAASLAEHIHRQHKEAAGGVLPSPDFVWVLRDFTLALENTAGVPISEQEYLEQSLSEPRGTAPPGSDERHADLRDAREKIKELFPRRQCACLVRPVDEEEQLQRLSELPLSAFRPKFTKQMDELRRMVLGGCQPLKSISGQVATCGAFIALAEAHVEAMNSGGVPQLGSAWQQVSRQECGRAVDEALRVFSAATMQVLGMLPCSDEDLQEVLQRGETQARQKFQEVALGDPAARAEHEAELTNSLAESRARLQRDNLEAAIRENESWLRARCTAQLDPVLQDYRSRFEASSSGLPADVCSEAEKKVEGICKDIHAAYQTAAMGPQEARDGPWGTVFEKRMEAAKREFETWRGKAAKTSEADANARRAAAEERQRLEAESKALTAKADQEIEESKARTAKREQERRTGEDGVQNWDAADLATADPAKVELQEKGGQAGKSKGDQQQKKCCAVQ